ncbi:hypothetical protein BRD00_01340 [Halobacteriales archaeon QS_8_69_26]|nr:MAG: hypothetical protein BRD00_01340 [Halobacteriales archaeon QS_8_69_26]
MNSEDEGGYVHDPEAFREDDDASGDGADRAAEAVDGSPGTGEDAASGPGSGLGTRGWVLLATVVLSFFVVPGIVLLRPPGLPFEVALLVLPLLPAVLLGVASVWAMAARG